MAEIYAVYPSGKRVRIVGIFQLMAADGYPKGLPAVAEREDRPGDPSPVVVLDPRAVITSDGVEVYNGKDVELFIPR